MWRVLVTRRNPVWPSPSFTPSTIQPLMFPGVSASHGFRSTVSGVRKVLKFIHFLHQFDPHLIEFHRDLTTSQNPTPVISPNTRFRSKSGISALFHRGPYCPLHEVCLPLTPRRFRILATICGALTPNRHSRTHYIPCISRFTSSMFSPHLI